MRNRVGRGVQGARAQVSTNLFILSESDHTGKAKSRDEQHQQHKVQEDQLDVVTPHSTDSEERKEHQKETRANTDPAENADCGKVPALEPLVDPDPEAKGCTAQEEDERVAEDHQRCGATAAAGSVYGGTGSTPGGRGSRLGHDR